VAAEATGKVELSLPEGDAREIARALDWKAVALQGKVGGQLVASIGPGKKWSLDAGLSAPLLAVQGVVIRKLHGQVNYQPDKLRYKIEGETLGGRVVLEGPVAARDGAAASEGRLLGERLMVGALWRQLGVIERSRPHGVLTVDVPFKFDATTGRPVGRGRFVLRDLRFGNEELSDSIRGEIVVEPGRVRFGEVSAALAGGLLRMQGAYRLDG